MSQQRIKVSLPPDLIHYVNAARDADSLIAEALYRHREHVLDDDLARAYQEGAEESLQLHREWSAADEEFSE